MKLTNIITVMALLNMMYSCGDNTNKSKQDNSDSTKADSKNEQVKAESEIPDAELYKHFSKEEIRKRMQHTFEVLDSNQVYDGRTDIYFSYYELLKEDGFALTPKEIEAKWGKPLKKEKDNFPNPLTDEMQISYSYDYPRFILDIEQVGKDWRIGELSTNTVGFGFAGVYVGIPECNKSFIKKLFAKAESISEMKNNQGDEYWQIFLYSANYTFLGVTFDENGIVKEVSYFSGIYTT